MVFNSNYSNVAVVTGSNRGLGLEFVKQILSGNNHASNVVGPDTTVVAACRSPEAATELIALKQKVGDRLIITRLDIAVPAQIEEFREFMETTVGRLDLLINNAGISEPKLDATMGTFNSEDAAKVFQVNTIAPVKLTQTLLPLIESTIAQKQTVSGTSTSKSSEVSASEDDDFVDAGVSRTVLANMLYVTKNGKRPTPEELDQGMESMKASIAETHARVVFLSSSMGSIAVLSSSYSPSYRASKAALNMYIRCFSKEFPQIAFLALHPGWVQTDMGSRGNASPPVKVTDSIDGCLKMISLMNLKDSGNYLESFDQTIWPF